MKAKNKQIQLVNWKNKTEILLLHKNSFWTTENVVSSLLTVLNVLKSEKHKIKRTHKTIKTYKINELQNKLTKEIKEEELWTILLKVHF